MRVVDRIRIPALVIAAADDPFVPSAIFRNPILAANPNIQVMVSRTRRPLRISRPVARTTTMDIGRSGMIVEFAVRQASAFAASGGCRSGSALTARRDQAPQRTAGPSLLPRA